MIATGIQYSVRNFIQKTAAKLGIVVDFEGEGIHEEVVVRTIEGDSAPALKIGDVIVKVDPRYFRPTEVETLLGDPGKAETELGWVPEITLDQMVAEMTMNDLAQAKRNALLTLHGYKINVSVE